jgi:glycerol-3-phosphate acyltransferase PlsY
MQIIINCILSYLAGSISGSMVLGKLKGIDIRKKGSGNAGGTNAFRTVGLLFALGVVLIDVMKGIVSVLLISNFSFYGMVEGQIFIYMPLLCGAAAVMGHVYPVYYNFNGGKGAGTLIGVLGVLFPFCIPFALISWILVLVLTGFVGLGTMVSGVVVVLITHFAYPFGLNSPFGFFSILMALFIFFTHRSNIYRMYQGEENQFQKIMLFNKFFK